MATKTAKRTFLEYTGPDPAAVGIVPLPEGWPAEDHEEPDAVQRAAKVASGRYKLAAAAAAVEE